MFLYNHGQNVYNGPDVTLEFCKTMSWYEKSKVFLGSGEEETPYVSVQGRINRITQRC